MVSLVVLGGRMLLSTSGRYLFVHIAKTGGSSIRTRLRQGRWKDPAYWPQFVCHRVSHLFGHSLAVKLPRHAPIVTAQGMLPPGDFQRLF